MRLPTSVLALGTLACFAAVSVTSACQQRASVAQSLTGDSTAARLSTDSTVVLGTRSHDLASPGLAPLDAAARLVQLSLDGYGPATVAVPLGATERRPVVVALHAHAVRPEKACSGWQRAAHGWPFVLCPLGLPANAKPTQAVTLGSPDYTERELAAGLFALRARFAAYVSDGLPLLVGWSLGAEVAVELLERRGHRFERAAFGEGAYRRLDDRAVTRLRAAGVERVLLLCSTLPCETSYSRTLTRFGRVGILSRVWGAGNGEHPFDGAAVQTAARAWPWFVADDPRFVPL